MFLTTMANDSSWPCAWHRCCGLTVSRYEILLLHKGCFFFWFLIAFVCLGVNCWDWDIFLGMAARRVMIIVLTPSHTVRVDGGLLWWLINPTLTPRMPSHFWFLWPICVVNLFVVWIASFLQCYILFGWIALSEETSNCFVKKKICKLTPIERM